MQNDHCPLWSYADFVNAIGVAHSPEQARRISDILGVSIDTRTLTKGDVFVALPGAQCHGSALVDDAFAKGASAVMVESAMPLVSSFCVPNARNALWNLAVAARKRYTGPVVAVTGSTGKTTVKDGIGHALRAQRPTFVSRSSFNNSLGVSVSLANLPRDVHYAVFEHGMDRSGQIQSLVQRVQPTVAMVTNVSCQHMANFNTVQDIARAKAEIMSVDSVHTVVLNHDCDYYDMMRSSALCHQRIITFGRAAHATVRIDNTTIDGSMMVINLTVQGHPLTCRVPNIGAHWATNTASILAAVLAVDGDIHQAAHSLSSFYPPVGRGHVMHIGGMTIIDDSYNAAPKAMEKALTDLAQYPAKGKKYGFLGAMHELGNQEEAMHRALVPFIQKACDHVWVCGSAFRFMANEPSVSCTYADDIRDMIQSCMTRLNPGDVVLVKGARGMETFAFIYALLVRFGGIDAACTYPLRVYMNADTVQWVHTCFGGVP